LSLQAYWGCFSSRKNDPEWHTAKGWWPRYGATSDQILTRTLVRWRRLRTLVFNPTSQSRSSCSARSRVPSRAHAAPFRLGIRSADELRLPVNEKLVPNKVNLALKLIEGMTANSIFQISRHLHRGRKKWPMHHWAIGQAVVAISR
jgi:hypothetical protein